MLKGKSEIILTDVNNGKQQKIKEENMVTNVFNKLLNHCFCGNNVLNSIFPLNVNGLGGILLLDDTVDENPNNYLLPKDCNIISTGCSDANITTNNYMGSFNEEESKVLENGYKFVWDFTTNQSNGVIKSLALTSNYAGRNMFGGGTDNQIYYGMMDRFIKYGLNKYYRFSCFNLDNECYYLASMIDSQNVKIKQYNLELTKFNLLSNFESIYKKEYTINFDEIFNNCILKSFKSKFYLLMINKNSKKMQIRLLNKDNLNIIENVDLSSLFSNSKYISNIEDFAVLDDKICFLCDRSSLRQYVLADLYNPTNFIDLYAEHGMRNSAYVYTINVVNNRFVSNHCVIDINGNMKYFERAGDSDNWQAEYITEIVDDLIYFINYHSSSTNYLYISYTKDYLATINNLSTPIIKNSTQTMKITYEITEE